MAEEKPTTSGNGAGTAAPFKLPTVAIPDEVGRDKYGFINFTIQTSAGDVEVSLVWKRAKCRGSVAALVAAGFMLSEWEPGLNGNNSTHQTVAFEVTGPRLILGSRKGIQTKEPRIVIERKSRRTLVVEVPLSAEQWEWVKTKRDEEKQVKQNVPAAALTPDDAHAYYRRLVESALDWIRKSMAGTGCAYSDESMNRIHQAYEELRRAFSDGRVVAVTPPAPKYQRVGNVICWPGAGSVEPVAPSLLLH